VYRRHYLHVISRPFRKVPAEPLEPNQLGCPRLQSAAVDQVPIRLHRPANEWPKLNTSLVFGKSHLYPVRPSLGNTVDSVLTLTYQNPYSTLQ
jgi:hypothetical protein